jgi:hypothetical protein
MKAKLLICLSIFCLSVHARGQGTDGWSLTSLKLRDYCKSVGSDRTKLSSEEYNNQNICLFYVSGVLDGFQIGDRATKLCVPSGASLGELALVVSKYLDRHPEKLHNPPQYLIIDALHTAFPCDPDPPKK